MLGKIFNTFFPIKEFLNYLFKKTLGDYILNDLDLNKIEIEISNKAFISLKNIDLNAADINKKHLDNLPFLMLEGQIKNFDLSFSMDKICINIDKLNVLLMPIFNREKSKNLISLKQTPIKIIGENKNNSFNRRSGLNTTNQSENKENSLVSSFLNSALGNLEINITNISISMLSYEASNTIQDNPIFTFFITEICFRNKTDEDLGLIKNSKNPINKKISDKKKDSNLNLKNSSKHETIDNKNNNSENINKVSSDENSSKNQIQFSFLHNKILLVDKIIMRIHQQSQNVEEEFFNMTNENEEKTTFKFLCNNSTIMVFDYKTAGYSILVDFVETLDNMKNSDTNFHQMRINIDLKKIEICITPLQMQLFLNFIQIFDIISLINKEKKPNDAKEVQINKSDDNLGNIKYIRKKLSPFVIFRTNFNKFKLNLHFEGFNVIILESNYMKELPKLWSFYQENYSKKIDNVYAVESHFSYMEDNFFFLNLSNFKIKSNQNFLKNREEINVSLEKIHLRYIEFMGKKRLNPSISQNKLLFNENNKNIKQCTYSSFYNSPQQNEPSNSKVIFNSQIQKQKMNQGINNSLINSSNNFFIDKSMNRSKCSIYESVREYDDANFIDYSNIKNSINKTIYQSTLESKDALLERYNIIFESEYSHQSHSIFELTNKSITENVCLVVHFVKEYFPIKIQSFNNDESGNRSLMKDNLTSFAEYFNTYMEVNFKKIVIIFNPIYLFKISKLVFYTQIIINEFLYLLDGNYPCNNEGILKEIGENFEEGKTKINENSNNEQFINKSNLNEGSFLFEVEEFENPKNQENLCEKKINLSNENNEIKDCSSKGDMGCYEKSKQILLIIEEMNLKVETIKKDFYDKNGICLTSSNSNLDEEFKNYEEFSKNFFNTKFLSNYFLNYFKYNINPFITNIEKNEYNKSLIGKKIENRLDKHVNFHKLKNEYFEIIFTNHKILINNKIKKNEIYSENKLDSLVFYNKIQKINYDFNEIFVNYGLYNLIKIKRDLFNFSNGNILFSKYDTSKIENNNFSFEYKNDSEKKIPNLNFDIDQQISKNDMLFRLSPLKIKSKTLLFLNSDPEHLEDFKHAENNINEKIQKIYKNHNLNLFETKNITISRNTNFSNDSCKTKKDSNKLQTIIKNELIFNFYDDIFITIEPQFIKKLLTFFDSLLFAINLHKLITFSQREIFNFYKQYYLRSLNIDNFPDFSFYFKASDTKKKNVSREETLSFSNIDLNIDNLSVFVLKNNYEFYVNQAYKNKSNNDYLIKLSILKPFANIISVYEDSNIFISIREVKISTYKERNKNSETKQENFFMRELIYSENPLIYKGDSYYNNIKSTTKNNDPKNQNTIQDKEKFLEKFKKHSCKNMITLVIKTKNEAKLLSDNNPNKFKKCLLDLKDDFSEENCGFRNRDKIFKNSTKAIDSFSTSEQINDCLLKPNSTKDNISFNEIFYELQKFETLVNCNLIFQSNMNMDIVIITNDIILSPLSYNDFNMNEIVFIAREFGIDSSKESLEKIKHKNIDSTKGKGKSNIKQDSNNLKTNDGNFNKIDGGEDFRIIPVTSEKLVLDLKRNLEKIVEQENKIGQIQETSERNKDLHFSEKNKKFINLFKPGDMNINFNIEINRLSFDLFVYDSKQQNGQISNYAEVKEKIRLIIHIEKLSHNKEFNFENGNMIRRVMNIQNFKVLLLKNLDHEYAGCDILKLNNGRFSEDSIFKYLGFVELISINSISFGILSEIFVEKVNFREKIKFFNDIDIQIGDLEANLCKDSFDVCIEISEILKDKVKKISSIFSGEIIAKNEKKENNQQNNNKNCDHIDVKLDKERKIPKDKEINDIDDYFEENNMENLLLVDDYCNNSRIIEKNLEFEYEKISLTAHKKSFDSGKLSSENMNNNRISIDSKVSRRDRKEETIIDFEIKSAKVYIFDGLEFDFIKNQNLKKLQENKKYDKYNEKKENEEEILCLITNSLSLHNNFVEHQDNFNFYYDENFNSIKISGFDLENIFDGDKQIGNKSMSNSNPTILNSDEILKNKKFWDSFEIIEKFYSCANGQKSKGKILKSNDVADVENKKQNLDLFELEKNLKRKKQNQRDYNNHICLNLEGVMNKFSFYKNNERIMINVFLNKFDIDDNVKSSKFRKIISKYQIEEFQNDIEVYNYSKKVNKYRNVVDRPLLDLSVDIVKINEVFNVNNPINEKDNKRKKSEKKEENVIIINNEGNINNIEVFDMDDINKKLENDLIYIDGFISPINILIDQATLLLLLKIFVGNERNNKKEKEQELQTESEILKNEMIKKKINYKNIKDPLNINNQNQPKKQETEKKKDGNVYKEDKKSKNQIFEELVNLNYSITDSNLGVETFSLNQDEKNETKDQIEKKTFVKNVKINDFFILFSYNSHEFSLEKLSNKEYLELLNFSNISDLKIEFRRFDHQGFLSINEFPMRLINFWINDIKKEKTKVISNVLNSIGIIKPFTQIMSGLIDVIKLPYDNYMQDKSLTDGFLNGFKNLIFGVTSQTLFLGEKSYLLMKKLFSNNVNTSLDKDSYYKKFLYMINSQKRKYDEYYYK